MSFLFMLICQVGESSISFCEHSLDYLELLWFFRVPTLSFNPKLYYVEICLQLILSISQIKRHYFFQPNHLQELQNCWRQERIKILFIFSYNVQMNNQLYFKELRLIILSIYWRTFKYLPIQIQRQMSLKQQNDILQKLIKQINSKDKQIQLLKKDLNKALFAAQNVKGHNQGEKQLQKKITLMQKQHKEKISSLTQQIRSKSNQNKDLKERINKMKNIQIKEKQQTSEILKKTSIMASHDPKFAAIVSNYESQMQKKDKYIANLQKQIKQNYYKLKQDASKKQIQNEEQNDEPIHQNIKEIKSQNSANNQNYHTKYQQQIGSLKAQNNKLQRLLQEKAKQFKDITKKYSDLTKQYYKILNQYGQGDKGILGQKLSNFQLKTSNAPQKMNKMGNNILQQMINDCSQLQEQASSQASLSYSFLSGMNKIQKDGSHACTKQNENELQSLQQFVNNIIQILEVSNRYEIIPYITKLKINTQQFNLYENVSKYMQSMLYRLGMGKIPMSNLLNRLEVVQQKLNKLSESADLLDELCIEVGAKRQKIIQKIRDLKATQDQFFSNMKSVQFMQKLPKANKLIEFIQYFELDREVAELPDQLKKMYEQLKYIDRFLKQACLILNRQPQGLQRTLQLVLRYLQKKQAEVILKVTENQIKKAK